MFHTDYQSLNRFNFLYVIERFLYNIVNRTIKVKQSSRMVHTINNYNKYLLLLSSAMQWKEENLPYSCL